MTEIEHTEFCTLLAGSRILFLSDLKSLQGQTLSPTEKSFNLVVTDTCAEDNTITVDILERDSTESFAISHMFLQDAVWLLTPRMRALVDAARAAREALTKTDPRAALTEIRAQQKAQEARAQAARLEAEARATIADWFTLFDQDPKGAFVTPATMMAAAFLRDRIQPRSDEEAAFLRAIHARTDDYGPRVRMSAKQSIWMRDILSRSREALS